MKENMELETKKIIDLHKIDLRLQEIEELKGDLPLIIKEQQENMVTFNDKVDSFSTEITELNKLKEDYNVSISDFDLKIDKYNQQMDSVQNNKEYDALLIEIDHLKKENDELTGKILEIDEKIDDLKKSIEDYSEQLNNLSDKLKDNEDELQATSVEFSIEEKLLLKDKKSLLSKINDKDFLNSYQDKEKEILASIYNGSCNNCYTSLPAQTLVDVKKGLNLISCPSCSIFLYFDEE